ncbi:hypothetical protein ACFE04_020669 [Oxalis oulophora]
MNSQSQQQQQSQLGSSNTNQSQSECNALSFTNISKYFSSPLNDAAAALGACSTDLKKICRQNGLDRWPYRKFLSGKSIEEIKRYAAKERSKEILVKAKRAARQSISQPQQHETPNAQSVAPHLNSQQGIKVVQVSTGTSLRNGLTAMDEFKYGFPSNGLSVASNKWWGCSNEANSDAEIDDDEKLQSKEREDKNEVSNEIEKGISENGKLKGTIDSQGTGLLLAARKRSMEEMQEAVKCRVYSYSIRKLERRQSSLLVQIFRSPLPKEWISN